MDNYKIAFVGWNPFQFLHIKSIAAALPGAVFVLEKKKNYIDDFSDEILNNDQVPILLWESKNMMKLDGLFDIFIAQTMFTHIHMFTKSKLVFLQYGYAKEPHNYGTWRAIASLSLVYGEYALDRIKEFSPAVAVGNPRYDIWHEDAFHKNVAMKYETTLDASKKTLLYLPTWGELSSVDVFVESILTLAEEYNVLIKLHHNTDLLENGRVSKVDLERVHFFGANDDTLELLSLTDVVISDYSGAIFDAIYCDKPVVLLDLPLTELLDVDKIDNYSLEFSRREELGLCVQSPMALKDSVSSVFEDYDVILDRVTPIKKSLFTEKLNTVENVKTALNDLMEDKFIKSQSQTYLHSSMVEFYTTKRSLAICRKKKK